MEDFCNGPIWNETLSWNTENPNLTPCLRDAILPAVPCGILWLTLPIWIYWARRYQPKLVINNDKGRSGKIWPRMTLLFVTKVVTNVVLIVNAIGELVWRLDQNPDGFHGLYGSDVFYPCCLFITTCLTLLMLCTEKVYLIRSSPSLSLFWPFLALACVPNFKVEVESLISNDSLDTSRLILTMTLLPVTVIMLLLNIKADTADLKDPNEGDLCPENINSFASSLFLTWMDPLIWLGYKRPLVQADLPRMPTRVNVDENVRTFKNQWASYLVRNNISFQRKAKGQSQKKAALWIPLLRSFGLRLMAGFSIATVHYTITFMGPQVLKLLIDHIESDTAETWKGYLFSGLLFGVYFISTTFFQMYLIQMYSVAISTRSAVVSTIVEKSLKLSSAAKRKFTTGEITNLVSIDAQRLMETAPYLAILWAAPYQAILGMVFVYKELGAAALAGVAVLTVLVPINAVGSKVAEILQRSQLKAKDSRIKLMNEILAGVKVLKLYAWEIPFMERILGTRDKEIKVLRKTAILSALNNFTYSCSPILITIGAFSVYALSNPEENILTPQKVFVSMALFNLMRIPLTLFPATLREVIKTYVSIKRITAFLNAEELDEDSVEASTIDESNAIEFESATLAWEEEAAILKNLDFTVPKGSLTAVIGVVGSGKSSLLSAVLGEMIKENGMVRKDGSVAYVAQQAWIQNLTLRDNILFGKPFSQQAYKRIIDSCSLKADLKILMHGDATEIGENGINLSGGQKQRVNLARAVYADQDIYLLDDPLSAVDAHVGKHIFERVISNDRGLLASKTRLWVTNNLSYLQSVDNILVMADGRVVEQGKYEELISKSGGTLARMLKEKQEDDEKEEEKSSSSDEDSLDEASDFEETLERHEQDEDYDGTEKVPPPGGPLRRELSKETTTEEDFDRLLEHGKLVKDERAETGSVRYTVYLAYFKSIGYRFTVTFLSLVALQQVLHLGGNIWLSKWSDKNINVTIERNNNLWTRAVGDHSAADVSYYLMVYSILGVIEVVVKLGNDLTYFQKCATASREIHKSLLNNVLRSPMSFFDTNPTGRIVNRFTSDLDTMDQMIPFEILDMVWCMFECLATILLISVTTPMFIAAIIPLAVIYLFIQRIYITSSRQLKRLYSISKSPIFSHFTETINGATTIRAYREQSRFIQHSQDTVATNVRSVYLNFMSNRWLGTRLENLGNMIIFFASLFAIVAKDSLTPAEAALSITSSLGIIGSLVWVVRMACQLENDCVAIERIMEYTKTKQEASWEDDGQLKLDGKWPSQGRVKFEKYQTRYRDGLDLVLKGIDMEVNGEEKLGICGRTGAGKSSLTMALFRIIEPADGKIFVDSMDISQLGLHTLRSKLTIIPQDPVLFTGDLRFNLDPLGRHQDEEIWRSLELAHLKNHVVQNMPDGLGSQVSEGGSNFSVGQRQLICLARALLRKTKILVLDEATAAIDQETDELIQDTIRNEFSDCTVLTIAHRLNTIMDYDRVAVFKAGQLDEIDNPVKLLKTEGSSFKALASDAKLL